MMIDMNIVGSAKYGRDRKISMENTYNMYVSDNCLVSLPGYKLAKAIPGKLSRGIYPSVKPNIMIIVIDDGVFEVDAFLNFNRVGDLETSQGPVYIASNKADPVQFCVSDLSNIYLYKYKDSFQKVDLPYSGFAPGYMDFQDGYFICPDRNSDKWSISHENDGLNWEVLDSSTGLTYQGAYSTKSDTVQACVVLDRQVFVMATTGTEIYYDVGNTLFPYQKDNSIAIDYGCASIESIASAFGIIAWLGKNENSNPTIVFSTGGAPKPIEIDGIDYVINQIEFPQFSSGFIYKDGSHTFYQITFYKDNLTLLYDFTENRFYTLIDQNYNQHPARKMIMFNNKTYFISFPSDSSRILNQVYIYEFNQKYTTFDGHSIPRIRVCPPIRKPDSSMFKMSQAIITMKQGACPQKQTVLMAKSQNGGISFGDYTRNHTNNFGIGPNRMVFRQLGAANDATFKFEFWSGNPGDPVRNENGNLNEDFVITGGMVEIK